MKRKVLLAVTVICLTANATASAGGAKRVPPAKANCIISKILYKGASIMATGSCKIKVKVTVRKRVVTRTKVVVARWSASETDWDANGYACGSPHRIADKSIFMGVSLPYKVTGQFALTARSRPSNRAVKTFNHVYGGNFFQCGPQPPVPPDPTSDGLCQWQDAPVPNCGIPVAGKDACFWNSKVQVSFNTVTAGSITCPANTTGGYCQYASAGDPSKPPPTVNWLGSLVQLVYLTCNDGSWAGLGVTTVKFVGPTKTCVGDERWSIRSFQVKPDWGGSVYVVFKLQVYTQNGDVLGNEYETAVFDLHGTKDACTELGLALEGI